MELYVTYHKILDLLQQFQENNPVLKSFGYGNLVEFGDNVSGRTTQYPFFYVVPQSIAYDQNTTTYQLSLLFADRLNEDKDNEKDAVSDMSLVARDFISQVMRGNLMDKMDMIMPVNAIPFMERFNDYVAGVALDAQLVIFEDVNACVEYPTPTPSNTPNLSPTSTPTPTPTPTTPSSQDPSTLGALWWIDFTDASTLTLTFNGTNITNAVDKINGVNFSQFFGNTGPYYNPTGYLSVSGTAQEYINPLQGTNGLYTQNYSGITWFGYVYDDFVSQLGGNIFVMSSNSPSSSMLGFINTANIPNTWRSFVDTSAGPINVDIDITYSAWTAIAIRTWEESGNVYLELWENGSIIGQTSIAGTLITPTNIVSMNLMWGGGVDFNTEQSFFDRKLTDSEMGQMFTYINNKY